VTVPGTLTVDQLVSDYIYEHHFKMFPVVDDGRLVGCVTTQQVKQVPRTQWAERTVAEITTPCSAENGIGPDEDALAALKHMSRHQVSRLMVVEDGILRGVVSLKDLLEFLALKLELEGDDEGAEAKSLRAPGPAAKGSLPRPAEDGM